MMRLLQICHFIRFYILLCFTALLCVACQTATVEPAQTDADDSCRVVEHDLGTAEVCGQPQRVVALAPHLLDRMLALGIQPAALAQNVNPGFQIYDNPASQIPYLGKWVTTEPVALGSIISPSLERLVQLKPDLIIGATYSHDGQYKLLNRIAPTVLFSDVKNPDEIQSWEQDIGGVAESLGKEDRVEALLEQHEADIERARAALQPVLQAFPRVFLMSTNLNATQIQSQPESSVARLLQEVGFEIVRPSDFSDKRVTISPEIVPEVETDLIIVKTWDDDISLNSEDTAPQATMRERWRQDPLFNSMPVFQQGRVFFVDYYLWSGVSRGPLSDQLILDALPSLLLPSLDGE